MCYATISFIPEPNGEFSVKATWVNSDKSSGEFTKRFEKRLFYSPCKEAEQLAREILIARGML
jgi:hypothetical protein